MSTKKPTRRRIKVGGEEVKDDPQKKAQKIGDVFKLEKPMPEGEGDPVERPTYHPEHLNKFLMGQMTLGDLEGITKQQQYEIAEIGFGYLSSGKLDEAKKVFEGLMALDPFDAYFHMSLGSIAQQKGETEEADKRYSKALEINPFSATAHANRGELRVMGGRLPEGAADLVRAIELDPDLEEPGSQRAMATVKVLKEQLGAMDLSQLEARAKEATDSRVRAARAATKKARARPRPRPRPRKPKAKRPGPKKK